MLRELNCRQISVSFKETEDISRNLASKTPQYEKHSLGLIFYFAGFALTNFKIAHRQQRRKKIKRINWKHKDRQRNHLLSFSSCLLYNLCSEHMHTN